MAKITKEDAIFCEKSYIGETSCIDCKYYGTDTCLSIESHRMAVKALEQEPVLDKIRAEIREWYWDVDKQELAKDPCVVDAMIDLFIRTIDKYKAGNEVEG